MKKQEEHKPEPEQIIIDANALGFPDIAAEINREHKAAKEAAREVQEHIIKCGELLMFQRSQVGRGNWIKWVRANCDFGERTAQIYMQLARYAKRVSYWEYEDTSMRAMLRQMGLGPRLSPVIDNTTVAFSWGKQKDISDAINGFESIKKALNLLQEGINQNIDPNVARYYITNFHLQLAEIQNAIEFSHKLTFHNRKSIPRISRPTNLLPPLKVIYYWIWDGFYLLRWIRNMFSGSVPVSQTELIFRRLNKLKKEIDITKKMIRELYEVSEVNTEHRGGIGGGEQENINHDESIDI